MGKQILKWSTISMLSLSLLACQGESTKLLPKPDPNTQKQKLDANISFSSKVDILFVVDDSGSMNTHQTNLIRNTELFVDEIVGNRILDYHIGVLSSTARNTWGSGGSVCPDGRLCGRLERFVSRNTVDGIRALKENFRLGVNGSAEEKFFEPVLMALTPPMSNGANAGFYRPDASLAVIFLTDAEDQSNISPQEFYNFLVQLKGGDTSKILTYGSIIPSGRTGCLRDSGDSPLRIESFFALSKGSYYFLCDPLFGRDLAKISADISAKVGRVILLERPPFVPSIRVTYGTQVLPNDSRTGWIYDPAKNAIILGREIDWVDQGPGVSILVEFSEAVYPTP